MSRKGSGLLIPRSVWQGVLVVATSGTEERLLASVGKLRAASIEFEPAKDITHGEVLWAPPALLLLGLLRHGK